MSDVFGNTMKIRVELSFLEAENVVFYEKFENKIYHNP